MSKLEVGGGVDRCSQEREGRVQGRSHVAKLDVDETQSFERASGCRAKRTRQLSVIPRTSITFPSRSVLGAPTCHRCNRSPRSEQPVGSEQMSKIPCWVIRLIYNGRRFQSPSPVCPAITEPGSNLILALWRRKSISGCLHSAPLIFMSRDHGCEP